MNFDDRPFDADTAASTGNPSPHGRLGYRSPHAGSSAGQSASAFRQRELLCHAPLVRPTGYLRFKPAFDAVLSVALAVLLLPVFLVTILLVKLSSAGPAFYSQTRLGRLGVPFRIFKFRSMSHNCEKQSGAKWASRNDTRVTPVGKFIRITHLDELPQLLNILRGEMSLVGPRPERPEFIPALEKTVDNYRLRMLVKPGVTGLAQIYLAPDTDVGSVQKKVIYDLYYIRHLSFWLDIRLIAATPLQAIGIPCGLVRRILLLPRAAAIEAEPMLPYEFLHTGETDLDLPSVDHSTTLPEIADYPLSDSKFGTSIAV